MRAEATRRTGASYPATAPRGTKRSAEVEPDDPRLTGDGPEAETIGGSPRGQKRDAEFPPDDPRLVAGGDESEVVNDMPTATGHRWPTGLRAAWGEATIGPKPTANIMSMRRIRRRARTH